MWLYFSHDCTNEETSYLSVLKVSQNFMSDLKISLLCMVTLLLDATRDGSKLKILFIKEKLGKICPNKEIGRLPFMLATQYLKVSLRTLISYASPCRSSELRHILIP